MGQASGGAQSLQLFKGDLPFMGLVRAPASKRNVLQHSVVAHRMLPVLSQPVISDKCPKESQISSVVLMDLEPSRGRPASSAMTSPTSRRGWLAVLRPDASP
eukprot:4399756-Pyramimonas_sp.AAC.1